jgi:hypothetical protein
VPPHLLPRCCHICRSAQQQREKQKKSKRFAWPVEVLKSGIFKICKTVPESRGVHDSDTFSDLKNSTCMYLCRHMRSAASFATEGLKQICTATDEKKT